MRIPKHYLAFLAILIFFSSIIIYPTNSLFKIDKQYNSYAGTADISKYQGNSTRYENNFSVEADNIRIDNFQSSTNEIDDFTLFVYIIGSSLEDATYEATKDINEMLKAQSNNDKVNVVLQTGGAKGEPDGTRIINFSSVKRHYISNNIVHTLPQDLGQVNMGDSKTLTEFLSWGIYNFPAKKYGLIFWGHGAGVQGFGGDLDTGVDSLFLNEIISSLIETRSYPSINFKNFEFIGFDSCLMGTFEIASLLNPLSLNYKFSNFLIGSEEIEPNWGWNYTDIVNSIASNPEITGDMLGKKIIESFVNDSNRISEENKFYANRDITLSVINLTRMPELNQQLSDITNSTIDNLTDQESLLKLVRTIDVTESFGETHTETFGMIDLYDFLSNLANAIPSLEPKINEVKDEIDSAVIYNYSGDAHPNANGLSIFFPLSLSDTNIIGKVFGVGSPVTYNLNWLNFINSLGSLVMTDKFSPVIQSDRNGNAINVRISDPDVQKIFVNYVIQSSKGVPISYIQNLDPNLINETGFFRYEDNNRMLALCNEKVCLPVSMTMKINKDSKRIFIPVEIRSSDPSNPPTRVVSLVYQFQNNSFFFLGGVDELQIRGGQSAPKEKVNLEQGDTISPQGSRFNAQPFLITGPKTIKTEIIDNFINRPITDQSLIVTDPTNITPKFVDINQTSISILFCDFSNHCDQTRRYNMNTNNDTNYPFEPTDQNQGLPFNRTTTLDSNDLTYVDQKNGFKLEYPTNWLPVPVDPYAPAHSQIYFNDPAVLLLFPLEEITNSNGSDVTLQNRIDITMREGSNTDPKEYFDLFNNTKTQADYELSNASETSINGYSAFEFILTSQKIDPFSNEKDAKRLEYILTISANRKEYSISFASEEAIFYKYFPTVKEIISSFRPIDEVALQGSANELNGENNGIVKIREIMTDRMLKNILWKEYTDRIYNFTLSYPYIDKLNIPVAQHLDPLTGGFRSSQGDSNTYLVYFRPPSNNFLGHPYKYPSLVIEINNTGNVTQTVELKRQAFNYEFINSTSGNLLDGSLTTIYEHKYFLPIVYQWVYEKEAYAYIDDKSISLTLVVPLLTQYDNNYILYESMFDNILNTFKIQNKR